jgi:hypothetical protein
MLSASPSMARFLACWVTQPASGLAVTPAIRTRLVPTSIKNSTYRVLRNTVSTVKRSQLMTPCACALRNSDHEGPVRLGAGGMLARRRSERMVVAPTR